MPFEPGNPYRFQPGHEPLPGAGRPPKSTEDAILDAFRAALTPEAMEAIALKVIEQSKSGQNKSLRILLEYLIGTPVQRNRVDVSQDMIELLRNWREADKDTT